MSRPSTITVTDQFHGAGGSSLGAMQAGLEVVFALNHWPVAVQTHETNFPFTRHECVDISVCNPRRYPGTTILLTSPECTNHCQAKGVKRAGQRDPARDLAAAKSRATMFDVPRFAECHRYELILVENVVEARHWVLFDAWLLMTQALDYRWEIVYFNSQFAPPAPSRVPQSRDRMYVAFWKKGNPAPDLCFCPLAHCRFCGKEVEAVQSWKDPTKEPWGRYGPYGQYLYRCPRCLQEVIPFRAPATDALDWTYPITRIGERRRPLTPKTMQLIETGLNPLKQAEKHSRNRRASLHLPGLFEEMGDAPAVDPFLVSYYGQNGKGGYVRSAKLPMGTIPTRHRHALLLPGKTIDDCFYRMVQPRELRKGMAFPETYTVFGTKREQLIQYGNAVTPPVMAMLLERCVATLR